MTPDPKTYEVGYRWFAYAYDKRDALILATGDTEQEAKEEFRRTWERIEKEFAS